jgi:hypothetical protein
VTSIFLKSKSCGTAENPNKKQQNGAYDEEQRNICSDYLDEAGYPAASGRQ